MASVALKGLVKRYDALTAVGGVDLTIADGEMMALVGPSGCGKTTILRMIAGLIEPDGGQVLVGGEDITDRPVHRRNLGLVFQSYALFPHLSVFENVAFGLRRRRVPDAMLRERVARALDLVKLAGLGERFPKQLSGGQQQRVALARAVVTEPRVLLLDEPLSNLDALLRDEMRVEIKRLQRRLGITTVFVTHDQEEALTLADRVAVLNRGRLEQCGAPQDVYDRPATPFVAGFLGRSNFLEATVADAPNGRLYLAGPQGLRLVANASAALSAGTPVSIVLRREKVRIAATVPSGTENAHRGRIVLKSFGGAVCQYVVRLDGGHELLVETPAAPGYGQGDEVGVWWDPADVIVLADGPRA